MPETTPPLYAMVQPGLEKIAADEILRDLGGDVRKTDRGIVVFRLKTIDKRIFSLRCVEDVYLYAWGTDQLTYRAADLDQITKWTKREPDWPQLLKIHHALTPKPKGKPTWHVVTQMSGEHGYKRTDARGALLDGLAGQFPNSWRRVQDDASIEVWLTIDGATAVCGLRLTDRTMRHRDYKREHRPASLRPTVAAAMVRQAGAGPGMTVVDPTCGAGTIVAEQAALARQRRYDSMTVAGGDIERAAVQAAVINLRRYETVGLAQWDAGRLPLEKHSVDRVIFNPPFGVQLGEPGDIGPLYRTLVKECDRVLKPDGKAVVLVADMESLRLAADKADWKPAKQTRVRVLGQPAVLSVWRKD